MKKIIALLVASVIILLAIENIELSKQKNSNDEYSYFEYVITEIQDNEYFGKSIIDESGIYFTSDYIASNNIIVGDTVKAIFEKDNIVDGLKSVEKIP